MFDVNLEMLAGMRNRPTRCAWCLCEFNGLMDGPYHPVIVPSRSNIHFVKTHMRLSYAVCIDCREQTVAICSSYRNVRTMPKAR